MEGVRAGEPVGPDVWETCRELIPAGSVFAFLAEPREALFRGGVFGDIYPSPNGRPSLPPQVLAAAVVLQALHGLSDFETVQVVRCDLRWKAACGLGLLDMAFDPSLLTYFRRRLARSADPNRLFSGSGRWWRPRGCWRARTGERWIRWYWMTRWPPRTLSPS